MDNERRNNLIGLMISAIEDGEMIHVEDLGYLFPAELDEARERIELQKKGEAMKEMDLTEASKNNYNRRHGGPWDRGSADSYYGRGRNPHYFTGATYQSEEIRIQSGTPEYVAYMHGYDWNEKFGDKKDWG